MSNTAWQDAFYKEMNKYYPYAEHIPEIKDSVEEFQKIIDGFKPTVPVQEGKSKEEILENILREDYAKMLLPHTERAMEHNGIAYLMVRKDLAISAMEAYKNQSTPVQEVEAYAWFEVPCSERLPEIDIEFKDEKVSVDAICLRENNKVTKCFYDHKDETWLPTVNQDEVSDVTHWLERRPLPVAAPDEEAIRKAYLAGVYHANMGTVDSEDYVNHIFNKNKKQ